MSKNPQLVIIGKKIKSIRESKKVLQDEAAFNSGLSRSYFSDIEKGYRNVSILKLVRIAKGLGVEIQGLLPSIADL